MSIAPQNLRMESFRLAFRPSTASHKLLKSKTCSPYLIYRTKISISQCHSSPRNTLISGTFPSINRIISNRFQKFEYDRRREKHGIRSVVVAAVADGAGSSLNSNNLIRTLQLGGMFVIWYSLNIYFNIYNKQVLKVYPFPATISAFQFGCGTVIALLMWTFKLHPPPKVNRSQIGSIFLLAVGHTVGNLLTNISLGKVAVSFTHTIKAMEPFFAVLLSILLLGEKPSIWIVSSLVPIVGGVALASFSEASFNWIGFGSAMASNLTNQTRNVYSKKIMVKEALDNINILSIMTIISFLLLLPSAILLEGVKLTPSYFRSAASQGLNVKEMCIKALVSGLCFQCYQQVSYNILGMVSPVTHSVGNCVKRVVVIVSSIIFFRTPISTINALGTTMALAGVFFYSRAKRIKINTQ